ncbi:hypothetical protein GGR52DRAFT_321615 [Hypoxylon sp. FL1284]|nr:hypothetical protein GGR52DRAFT_321615 [Hypoxylon sp. FL1284]
MCTYYLPQPERGRCHISYSSCRCKTVEGGRLVGGGSREREKRPPFWVLLIFFVEYFVPFLFFPFGELEPFSRYAFLPQALPNLVVGFGVLESASVDFCFCMPRSLRGLRTGQLRSSCGTGSSINPPSLSPTAGTPCRRLATPWPRRAGGMQKRYREARDGTVGKPS